MFSVGDLIRFRAHRPGFKQSKIYKGSVEYIGPMNGVETWVGINLGLPCK